MKKVSLILIFHKNKIVLFKRSDKNKYFKNMYGIIGGSIKHNETSLDCIKRELFEETNLIIEDIKYVNSYNYYDKQLNVYVGEIFDLNLIKLNSEHVDYKMFNEIELSSEIVIDTTKIFFNDFKNVWRKIEENETQPDRNSKVYFDVPSELTDKIKETIKNYEK